MLAIFDGHDEHEYASHPGHLHDFMRVSMAGCDHHVCSLPDMGIRIQRSYHCVAGLLRSVVTSRRCFLNHLSAPLDGCHQTWQSPPIDIRNFREITTVLPASWIGVGYLIVGRVGDEEEAG
ncbi:hypothetical protein EVAR_28289_1 [Eumeta japonica]|uniref:Uncharacterized protein n=1 Tax=Eumeta variegata TaxID=151549 RepID=A0A4C1V9K2_EUMVA|nr:hypothetical protein EVAR_28289_1 [Eumeta japonica]